MLCLVGLLVFTPVEENLHPAFQKTREQMEAAWAAGQKAAQDRRDLKEQLSRCIRGIGDIRTSTLTSETVSWAVLAAPEVRPFLDGYEAGRLYKGESETAAGKKLVIPDGAFTAPSVVFVGIITLMPSFGGAYQTIDRPANPSELSNVRTVLKVGKRILQPVKQPGDMLQNKMESANLLSIPQYTYQTSKTEERGQVSGPGGTVFGTANSTTTSVSGYIEHVEQKYTWYSGQFVVEFPVIDKDGKPLITEKDRDFELIVIYGKNERHAKYQLSDLVKPYK